MTHLARCMSILSILVHRACPEAKSGSLFFSRSSQNCGLLIVPTLYLPIAVCHRRAHLAHLAHLRAHLAHLPSRAAAWNPVRCEGLHEDRIKEVADAIVSSGLRDAGYRYVNIDDCWMAPKRSSDGHLQPHPKRFPSGMKALGDYIHSKGLLFGIYSCAGYITCEGWPASFGNERIDAADWASWGVDYLKYDFCGLEKVRA